MMLSFARLSVVLAACCLTIASAAPQRYNLPACMEHEQDTNYGKGQHLSPKDRIHVVRYSGDAPFKAILYKEGAPAIKLRNLSNPKAVILHLSYKDGSSKSYKVHADDQCTVDSHVNNNSFQDIMELRKYEHY